MILFSYVDDLTPHATPFLLCIFEEGFHDANIFVSHYSLSNIYLPFLLRVHDIMSEHALEIDRELSSFER